MPDISDLERRLARLEEIAFEGDGLQRSVTRLGMSANALGEALLQVDRNQQTLNKLGQELKEVNNKVVPREEQERVAEGLRQYQQKVIKRWFIALAIASAVVLALAAYVGYFQYQSVKADRESCLDRQRTQIAVAAYLEAVEATSTNAELRQRSRDILNELDPVTCDNGS